MRHRYSRFTGDDLDDLDLEDLLAHLSDTLLSSGFTDQEGADAPDAEQAMQELHDAILEALLHGDVLPRDTIDRILGDTTDSGRLDRLIDRIIEQLAARGYVTTTPDLSVARSRREAAARGDVADEGGPVRFEITDKALDFLGYRALRDLLGSIGRSGAGRHDTREMATSVEALGAPKPYEFGDTLNLDASSTILNAVRRSSEQHRGARAGNVAERAIGGDYRQGIETRGAGLRSAVGDGGTRPSCTPTATRDDEPVARGVHQGDARGRHPGPGAEGGYDEAETGEKQVPLPVIDVQYEDLMVSQGEFQSSCATILMLDCSHSMILYGEDRFTPAKRVALALATLIRTQYPGDNLGVVLFHDSAEEIPVRQLARVRVGPFHTNTREGLRLARRLLDRQRKDMRQIIMITDGKPSAITRPDGRIYLNPMGLDPFIVNETLAEVAACRRSGIQVNTFMLARDFELVSFVRKVAEICRGKAYFTTPFTLGQYVLMDYLGGKTRTIH